MNESQLYLYSFRFVLERLSWMGRDQASPVSYTLAHIIRFKLAELRHYEAALRSISTNIAWDGIAGPGQLDQPQRLEELQLADLVASAIGSAFNPDEFGNVETRYVHAMMPRLYRYKPTSAVTSYGLKMHPWNDMTKAAYPWVAAL